MHRWTLIKRVPTDHYNGTSGDTSDRYHNKDHDQSDLTFLLFYVYCDLPYYTIT